MIRRAISAAVSLVILAVLSYLVFFVPLGERTLAEHVERIAATDEARDLGEDATRAGEEIGETVRAELEARAADTADAGPVGEVDEQDPAEPPPAEH